jgi:hypothetical protein
LGFLRTASSALGFGERREIRTARIFFDSLP